MRFVAMAFSRCSFETISAHSPTRPYFSQQNYLLAERTLLSALNTYRLITHSDLYVVDCEDRTLMADALAAANLRP